MADQPRPGDHEDLEDGTTPAPTKRTRWATRKLKGRQGSRKRVSILERLQKGQNEKKRDSSGAESTSNPSVMNTVVEEGEEEEEVEATEESQDGPGPRSVFVNMTLPADAVDANGHPTARYERNKIRTAKYTPLSFIPKNLWYQFHNIANIYFLFLVILSIFSIFGAVNPGLNAVPLIVVVFITAVKDAIEDWRRTILDDELNNSTVHRLVQWTNVNISSADVSLWRRIKKATTRGIKIIYLAIKALFKRNSEKKGKSYGERAMDAQRASFETTATRRQSAYSQRMSYASGREDIQMTPVPSPNPRQDTSESSNPFDSAADFEADNPAVIGHYQGDVVNRRLPVSKKARFHQDYWKNVQVGDFLRIYNDDQIPADVVILATSDPDGACYVETKNLDGETNLKLRHALQCGQSLKHARDCEQAQFVIESEPPQPNLYQYSGVARWTQEDKSNPNGPGQPMAEPISINNMLLRGCNLRNTEWALCVVMFTGFDSKIMLNSGMTPSKRSRIARELNWNVVYNFIILFFMCFISGLVEGLAWARNDKSLHYFDYPDTAAPVSGLITFWAAVILLQNLVPIALFISLEIIKTLQAVFIYSDIHMYYDKLDYPCTPKSWNISDDVGQIEYIFSDKTGTLTQNVMEFKKATVNGIPYGEAYTEAQAGMQRRQGIDVVKEGAKAQVQIAEARVKMIAETRKLHNNPYLHDEDLTFVAPDYIADLGGESGEEQKQATRQFMLALSLCHSVIAEITPGDPPKMEFKAQSPDEAALVATARDVGFTVVGNSHHGIKVNVLGDEQEYTVLNTLEFNSTRKRMSAIIRMPDGKIMLFCKGADSIIYARLKTGEQKELRQSTAEHLEMFAREGLRTLCIAQRTLDEEEYQIWNKEHELAAAAINDREEKLERVSEMIEQELTLLGGTAIEDRLQEGVPDTIALLAEAGIKLWVLTGDKVETAINIGFSCNLLNNDMELIVFKIEDDSLSTAEEQLDQHLRTFNMTGSDEELQAAMKNHEAPAPTHAIVIDGDSLKLVLNETLRQKFLLLCKQCKSVLCCRVSPAQKAAVVKMVKTGLDVMTLSVGDGANDVAMIQEADVGVGIAGEEGRQAVMSSDYAIGQFRFLQRLILVHGRWSYRRLGDTIANFFYKNLVWTFALFWYQIYADFDQAYLYDYTFILLYNLAFSSLPVIFMGVLDQDVSDKVSLAVPQLYRRGIERKEWTQRKFWLYMLDGTYQSVICFFVVYLLFAPGTFVTSGGQDVGDRNRVGVYVSCGAVVVVNAYILLNCYRWDWLMVLLVAISCLLVFFWVGVWGSSVTTAVFFYQAAAQVFAQPSFWAVTFLMVVICLLPRFTVKFVQKVYFPYDVDIIREQVRQGKFDYLDEESSSSSHPPPKTVDTSATSSDLVEPLKQPSYFDDDRRPLKAPSMAPTTTTHNPRSQNNSDGTDYTRHRISLEPPMENPNLRRLSSDRPRPSFDRMRASMDRCRPSFEASRDFTTAARLTQVESSHSFGPIRSKMSRFSDE
ncbi:hypothetical protein VE00_09241 [Pseudogymnoascus sp. WSF 3629]|nr:hypothetical protein VE00_09241 [Pseudogymnoascus sp. WSF 3629]